MEKYEFNEKSYKLVKNIKDAFNLEEVESKLTDYFSSFDYVVGDYAYGKLRLKGFNDKSNKNFKEINDITKLNFYLEENCAYGCKYFILKKEKEVID